MAPERIPELGGEPHKADPFPADMWCLGEIAFQVLTQQRTFKDVLELRDYAKGRTDFPSGPLRHNGVSHGAIDFLQLLMRRQPYKRLSAREANEHSWMSVTEGSAVPSSNTIPSSSGVFATSGNNGTEWSGKWTSTESVFTTRRQFTLPPHTQGKAEASNLVDGDIIANQRNTSENSDDHIQLKQSSHTAIEKLTEGGWKRLEGEELPNFMQNATTENMDQSADTSIHHAQKTNPRQDIGLQYEEAINDQGAKTDKVESI